tara:strand:+ start:271 stop:489 length:219 start_codon:yes stop_codon:yes gene_type:complete
MNNIIYINKDPILQELDNSIDKASAKRMLAFKHFNNDLDMLDSYLNKNNPSDKRKEKVIKNVKENRQLKFKF